MQDNFTYDVIEQLIRYLDGELSPEERAATERSLQNDDALKERLENIVTARKAIKVAGLRQRVKVLHQQLYTEMPTENESDKIIRPSFRSHLKMILRIAAVFIFVAVGYGIYQYAITNSATVYADNFIQYQLPVNRGKGQPQATIDSLFSANDLNGVIQIFKALPEKKPKDHFLSALASLETGDSRSAIEGFKNVQRSNHNSTERYFEQETDYYLALAYLKAGDIDAAEKQLNMIKANKQHMFYQKANEISSTKIRILKMKQ